MILTETQTQTQSFFHKTQIVTQKLYNNFILC